MTKILGCLFIIVSTSLIGYLGAEKLEMRCNQLDDIIKMIATMVDQLRYSKGSCHAIIGEIHKREVVHSTNMINKFMETEQSTPFPIRWEQAMDSSDLVLDPAEFSSLRSISDILGAFSAEEQLTTLNGLSEYFRSRKELMSNYTEKQSKLYRVMGVVGGAAIVVFLI